MKTVIIDINCSASTVYYVGSQGDNNVTTLHFNNLAENGDEYAVTLQNSENTFRRIPLVNNEMVLSGGYTTQPGLLNAQVFVKKNDAWIAYSRLIKLMLLQSIQEDTPEPEPSESTPYVIYKEYNDSGYDITGTGPCVVQNEKTDVRIKLATNDYTEIDCLGGQYTLIKKVETSTNGIIGYFTNDDGVTEYIEIQDGMILNGPADGDNHWGLLSVSKDNKTLTKLDFVNGLKSDVVPTDESDLTNKKYVDNTATTTLNTGKEYTDTKISEISSGGGLDLIFDTSNKQYMKLNEKSPGVYLFQYYNQDAKFILGSSYSMTSYYILGGLVYLYKALSDSTNGEYLGYFFGHTDLHSDMYLYRLKNDNGTIIAEQSKTGPLTDFLKG